MTHEISDFSLSEDEILATCRRCMENVNCLLKSAKLLHNQGSLQYALGLYMYAVEEYGKAQLLKMHLGKHKIPIWLFGRKVSQSFSPHNAKIAEGFNNLPEECQILSVGLRFINNSTEKTRMYKIGRNLKVSVPPFTTGFFTDTSRGTKIEFDFKTACFYIDWDDENRVPIFEIAVDGKQLGTIIKSFETAVKEI
ncbi:MAG TPA: AbiV family abortive infection protein [Nitrososphaeraceae archaeon]